MSVYSSTNAVQQFDHLLDEAKSKREVIIQRPNGDVFLLRLVSRNELKETLPKLGLNLSRQEIVDCIREVRER
jgi:hypothetical protein